MNRPGSVETRFLESSVFSLAYLTVVGVLLLGGWDVANGVEEKSGVSAVVPHRTAGAAPTVRGDGYPILVQVPHSSELKPASPGKISMAWMSKVKLLVILTEDRPEKPASRGKFGGRTTKERLHAESVRRPGRAEPRDVNEVSVRGSQVGPVPGSLRAIAKAGETDLEFVREGANHEVWTIGDERLVIPRHREINEHTAKASSRKQRR